MEDINSPKLSGEKAADKLADKLNSGLFKQLSSHELDVFKQHLANRLKLVQDGPPSDINESIFSPDYLGRLRPDGDLDDSVEINIYKSPEGKYRGQLAIYSTSGRGMAAIKNLRLSLASIPIEQITPEYVISNVDKYYNLRDSNKKELTDLVNDIPSKIEVLEKKTGDSPIKERLKNMIRKELMGDNKDEEVLRDRYMLKLNMYKNVKKNNRSNFEIDQARKELIDAAKAYGIDIAEN